MPFFSIITVCLNSEKTIRRTLESVLTQPYDNYEYIVIDGASTDHTIPIVKEYLPRFNGKLRYLSEPDHGIYDAMNKGIRLAQGNWVGIINSDDNYLPNAFNQVVKTIETAKQAPDVIYSDMDYVDEAGHVVRYVEGDTGKMWKGMFVNHPTCFVSKACYQRFGLFDTAYRIVADYELMLRIKKGGGVFVKAPQKLAELHIGGISSNSYSSELEKHKVQRRYFSKPLCLYCRFRSFCAFKVKPLLIGHNQ